MEVRVILLNTITEHDIKESIRKGYNHYALALYLEALNNTFKLVDQGIALEYSIRINFNGKLQDKLLKRLKKNNII